MGPVRRSSPKVLQAIWERFERTYKATHGSRPSKRLISETYFDADPSLLARWTSEAGGPASRMPLARLTELKIGLEPTPDHVDELMTARLTELANDSPENEGLAAANWLADFLVRHPELDNEEAAILAAFRAARQKHPLGLYNTGDMVGDVKPLFVGLLARHAELHSDDHQLYATTAAGRGANATPIAASIRSGASPRMAALIRSRAETKVLLDQVRAARMR